MYLKTTINITTPAAATPIAEADVAPIITADSDEDGDGGRVGACGKHRHLCSSGPTKEVERSGLKATPTTAGASPGQLRLAILYIKPSKKPTKKDPSCSVKSSPEQRAGEEGGMEHTDVPNVVTWPS